MKTLIISRQIYTPQTTLGGFILVGEGDIELTGAILELPWLDNAPNISCIPSGSYLSSKEIMSSSGKSAIYLRDVPGRSGIFIHAGNKTSDIEGCILIGNKTSLIGAERFIMNSSDTLTTLLSFIKNQPLIVRIET